MKKVFIGLGISLAILLVLVGFNAYDRDEAAVKGMMGKLVSALEKGSVEGMRSLFAPFVVESTNKDGRLDDDAQSFDKPMRFKVWRTITNMEEEQRKPDIRFYDIGQDENT